LIGSARSIFDRNDGAVGASVGTSVADMQVREFAF
jgi:hypothetical protein